MSRTATSKKYQYIQELYTPEDQHLKAIQKSIKNDKHKTQMQLSPLEGKLLGMLLRLAKCKKVLEIGTLIGYSTAWIAKFLQPKSKIITIEKSSSSYQTAKDNLSNLPYPVKIEILHGNALEILPKLKDQAPFDAVFIDANKLSYPKYLEFACTYLKKGGLVVADNTFLFNQIFESSPDINVEMWQAMRKFNTMLADPSKFESIIIPTEEGLSLGIKK